MYQDTREEHYEESPWICSRQNFWASARENTGQKEKDTPSTRIVIKISDPARNQTHASELECRNSTNHATAKDLLSDY